MITLSAASTIVDAALAEGRHRDAAPLTIAVLDAGGHLVALKREDGSSLLRPDIAIAKAWGALGMGVGSRALARRAERRPAFMAAITALADGRIVPVPGGVLIRDHARVIVGAVGISGDSADVDEACAMAGIDAADFLPDTGAV